MATYIRFERGRDDLPFVTFGPFEWVQLTYQTLRVGPDGDDVAHYHEDWKIYNSNNLEIFQGFEGEKYSDIILFDANDLDLVKENAWYNENAKESHENALID